MFQQKKYTVILITVSLTCALISGLLRFISIEPMFNIQSSMVDGLLVWGTDRFILAGLGPIAIYIIFVIKSQSYNQELVVTRLCSRGCILRSQMCELLVDCMIVLATFMITSAAFAYIANDFRIIADNSENTYLSLMLEKYSNVNVLSINYIFLIIKCFVLNTLEMYLIVICAYLVRWIAKSEKISLFAIVCIGTVLGVDHNNWKQLVEALGIKLLQEDYYYELLSDSQYFFKLFAIIVIIAIISVVELVIIKRIDFIKNRRP